MSEKEYCPEVISGILLNDSQTRETIESFLRPEIQQRTGHRLILSSHVALPVLKTLYNSRDSKVTLYVPEKLSFSITELKNEILNAYKNLQATSSLSPNEIENINILRDKLNNKN